MQHINEVYPKQSSLCNCMNLRRASRAITQYYDDVLKPSGLTVVQMSLLRHTSMAETVTISELAKLMRLDRTTINRNMKPLLDAGLLGVKQGRDCRTKLVVLTDAGMAALAQGWNLWGEAQEAIKEYMGEGDLVKLIELLAKVEALVP